MSNTTTTTINMTPLADTSLVSNSSMGALVWSLAVGAGFAYGLGFVGNLLSLMVFYSQEEFRKISTGLLFLLITVANIFHLFALLVEFLTFYGVSIFPNMFLQCRLTYFVQNVSRAMSTYFMVTVAIDRLIRTEFPVRSRALCTRRNTLIVAIILLAIFSLFWSFYFYPLSSVRITPGLCVFAGMASFNYFINNIHFLIRAIFVCFIPVIIMLLANMRMLMNIRQSQRRVTNGATMASSETNRPVPSISSATDKKMRRMSALDRMLFNMMLANVITFIVSQVPFHTFMSVRTYLTGLDTFTGSMIRAALLLWSSLYFGVAFYFYCLGSPLFRQKFEKIFKKVFCCRATPPSRTNTARITT